MSTGPEWGALVATRFHVPRAGFLPRPVAWLSLDEADNDPARFWRYVAAALDRARPGVGGQVEALLRGRTSRSWEAVATAVINELSRPAPRGRLGRRPGAGRAAQRPRAAGARAIG